MTRILFLAFILGFSHILQAQELPRRALIGARFSFPDGQNAGVLALDVSAGSNLQAAGLMKGDTVLKINGEVILDPDRWSDILYDLRGGQDIELTVLREGRPKLIRAVLQKMPKEKFAGIELLYETVLSGRGQAIRTITSFPSGGSQRLPAIFIVDGLSCSSIELYPGRPITGWTKVLQDLVTKSGMVVMRVEKPGIGDSEGACGSSDLQDDIAAFRSSLKHLFSVSYVDTTKVIIYGSSMGSALAPALANEFPVAGIISDGTFVKTWFEHMLEIERRIQRFQGEDEVEIMRKMNEGFIPLYYGMLLEKKTYAQVIREKPWLKSYNYHAPEHMYGRPVSYYHQVQDFNFAKGWQELKAPARIIRGTNDWIMSDDDNDLILDILEASGHHDHILYRYPGLDHWNMIHENPKDSFMGKPGKWEDGISLIILDFAWEMTGLKP